MESVISIEYFIYIISILMLMACASRSMAVGETAESKRIYLESIPVADLHIYSKSIDNNKRFREEIEFLQMSMDKGNFKRIWNR